MKVAVFALLASSASAFTAPSLTFAVGKKAPPAAKTVAVVKKAAPAKKTAPPAPAKKTVAVAKAAPAKAAVTKAVKPAPKPVVAKKAAPAPVVKKAAPVKKVVVAKKAAPVKKAVSSVGVVPSKALPYEQAPALLDGSLPGDVGFDPCYLSTKADIPGRYFNNLFVGSAPVDGLTWYREAELMNGRIAQMAVLGFIVPGFGTLASDWTGYTNPLAAISGPPGALIFPIFLFMSGMEFRRILIIQKDGANYMAGDSQKWGQGEGRWNPFGLNYTPEEYAEKQVQEVKHCRLAMIGLLGLIFQANASGVGIVEQLGTALVAPEYASKAGYFLPEGI